MERIEIIERTRGQFGRPPLVRRLERTGLQEPSCILPETFFRCNYLRVQDVSGMLNEKSDEASPVIGFVDLRKAKGVTQKQVADALDLSERTVIDWESGKRLPKLYVWQIKALCELLSVSIFDLPDSFTKVSEPTQKSAEA